MFIKNGNKNSNDEHLFLINQQYFSNLIFIIHREGKILRFNYVELIFLNTQPKTFSGIIQAEMQKIKSRIVNRFFLSLLL